MRVFTVFVDRVVVHVDPSFLGIKDVVESGRRCVRPATHAWVGALNGVRQRQLNNAVDRLEEHLSLVERVRVLPVDAGNLRNICRKHTDGCSGSSEPQVTRRIGLPGVVSLRHVVQGADGNIARCHRNRVPSDDVRTVCELETGRVSREGQRIANHGIQAAVCLHADRTSFCTDSIWDGHLHGWRVD